MTAPHEMIATLPWRTRAVLEVLQLAAMPDGMVRISKSTIARRTSLSVREVDEQMRFLFLCELAEVVSTGGGRLANVYHVTDGDDQLEMRRRARRARAWAEHLDAPLRSIDGVSPTALRIVYGALWTFAAAEHGNDAWAAAATLQRACWGLSRREVFRCLRALQQLGLQETRSAEGRFPNGRTAHPTAVVRRVAIVPPPSPARRAPDGPAQRAPQPGHAAHSTPAHGAPERIPERVRERESACAHACASADDVLQAFTRRWFPRFAPRHSEDARSAVVARLAEGWTPRELVAAATDGLAMDRYWGAPEAHGRRNPALIFSRAYDLQAWLAAASAGSTDAAAGMLDAPIWSGTASEQQPTPDELRAQRIELRERMRAVRFTAPDFAAPKVAGGAR